MSSIQLVMKAGQPAVAADMRVLDVSAAPASGARENVFHAKGPTKVATELTNVLIKNRVMKTRIADTADLDPYVHVLQYHQTGQEASQVGQALLEVGKSEVPVGETLTALTSCISVRTTVPAFAQRVRVDNFNVPDTDAHVLVTKAWPHSYLGTIVLDGDCASGSMHLTGISPRVTVCRTSAPSNVFGNLCASALSQKPYSLFLTSATVSGNMSTGNTTLRLRAESYAGLDDGGANVRVSVPSVSGVAAGARLSINGVVANTSVSAAAVDIVVDKPAPAALNIEITRTPLSSPSTTTAATTVLSSPQPRKRAAAQTSATQTTYTP